MSRQRSATVTVHDVASYFSQEEWKLLHEWQKELYRNVMKEIHQALISLGPLIATTVFSLRAKEELCPVDNKDSERRHSTGHSPSDMVTNPDVLLKRNREEKLHLNNQQDTEGREINDHLSTGFPFLSTDICLRKGEETLSAFIDQLGEEVVENRTGPNAGPEVVSFCIKDEEETYCMEHQDRERIEGISSPTGDGTMNSKSQVGDYEKCTEKTSPYKTPSRKDEVKECHMPEKGAGYTSQLWSEVTREIAEDKAFQPESGFRNTARFSVYQETAKVQRSDIYNDWDSNQSHADLLTGLPVIQHNWRLYSCTECEKSFNKKEYLTKHKETHVVVRPYQCTECKKSFSKKGNLITHRRTHTGERPYHCATCNKSFSQKGILSRHQRIHLGERPYKCTVCEKSFIQKGHLSTHQRKHTKNR